MSRATYVLITDDEEIARVIKSILDQYRSKRWWKLVTKYFNSGESTEYYVTSEESKPVSK